MERIHSTDFVTYTWQRGHSPAVTSHSRRLSSFKFAVIDFLSVWRSLFYRFQLGQFQFSPISPKLERHYQQ